jgi:hypothetical protein
MSNLKKDNAHIVYFTLVWLSSKELKTR